MSQKSEITIEAEYNSGLGRDLYRIKNANVLNADFNDLRYEQIERLAMVLSMLNDGVLEEE